MRQYQSEPMKIGKHLWRIAVDDGFTVYEFIRISPYAVDMHASNWGDSKRWPRYNGNDTYDGLPLSLRKLHDANEPKFRHLLQRYQEVR